MKKFILPFAALAFLASCENDDNNVDEVGHDHEGELITTVVLHVEDTTAGSEELHFEFKDADGPGGEDPTEFDTIYLSANSVYRVSLEFLNESGDHDEHDDHDDHDIVMSEDDDDHNHEGKDITAEILEEANEHIICFTPDNPNLLSVKRTDTDGVYEIGLASEWTTQGVGEGEITISLKHQADGIKDGTCVPGETDVEIDFPFVIR